MSSAVLSLPRLVLTAVVFVAGLALGHQVGRAPLLVELAEKKATTAETAKLQAMASARVLSDAQTRGDQLTNRLAGSQAHITQLETEKRNAITRLTTGRPCLSGDAVRVLNSADSTTSGPVDVPATASSTAATDEAFATDTDIGNWIAIAKSRYEICSDGLDALIDWLPAPPTESKPTP